MKRYLLVALVAAIGSLTQLQAQAQTAVTVVVDQDSEWLGFMNVSDLPANGGAYVFGSGWGTDDLVAKFNSTSLTLSPNVIEDPDVFWYQNTTGMATNPLKPGGPGQAGNKIMDANMYVLDNTLLGKDITFQGNVSARSLTSAHKTFAFIREFDTNFNLLFEATQELTATGAFSVNLEVDPTATNNIQYGFSTVGVNVWATDVAPFGSIVIDAINGTVDNGDFNGSGVVGGEDHLTWQRNYGSTSGALATGDANGDGNVDGADLGIWQAQYGPVPSGSASVGAVPEPASAALVLLGVACLGAARRRV